MAAGSEKKREIRRRRKRKVKMELWRKKVAKASSAEKEQLITKIRHHTPGHLDVLKNLELVN
jgi:hypothetical protein